MKKILTKLTALMLVVGIVLASSSTVVFAATGKFTNDSAYHTFTSAWEDTGYNSTSGAYVRYGFNTFLINEDYTWAQYARTNDFRGIVQNGNGVHNGWWNWGGLDLWSRIEVTHNGTNIYYTCEYEK